MWEKFIWGALTHTLFTPFLQALACQTSASRGAAVSGKDHPVEAAPP